MRLDLPDSTAAAYGPSQPELLTDIEIVQDDRTDPTTSSVKHDFEVADEDGFVAIYLHGEAGDDLDMYLLHDADEDGEYAYPDELVAWSEYPAAEELLHLYAPLAVGDYQLWVYGFSVQGENSTADLVIHNLSGGLVYVAWEPESQEEGEGMFTVCSDLLEPEDANSIDSLFGAVVVETGLAPRQFVLPLKWSAAEEARIYLPFAAMNYDPMAKSQR
jgi:hypothetical protein